MGEFVVGIVVVRVVVVVDAVVYLAYIFATDDTSFQVADIVVPAWGFVIVLQTFVHIELIV